MRENKCNYKLGLGVLKVYFLKNYFFYFKLIIFDIFRLF
jgi:hypothetical protein